MTKLKPIPFLAFLLIIGASAAAQKENSDAFYLSQVKEYTLNKDGSWNYHYSNKLGLNTYFAFQSVYGEDFVVYNPAFQKLKINHSVTTMADETRVISPENAFNELLPGFAANAPAYNHLREMAVTHTGIERGAMIDFDYTLLSNRDFSEAMTANDQLLMNSPVEKLSYIIHIPNGTTLNVEQFYLSEKPVIKKDGSGTTYTWNISNLPAASREDFRTREQLKRPRIIFSTAKNAAKLFGACAAQPAFSLKAEAVIQKTAQQVREEKKSDFAVMMRLQDLVANDLNYFPVPLSAAGFRVRTAAETFNGNGGTEAEKAVLLASLLTSAGIPAEVVVVVPERYYNKNSCNLNLVERFLVKAGAASDEPLFLSPLQADAQDQAFTLPGKKIISLQPGKNFRAETLRGSENNLDFSGQLTVLNRMLEGTATLELGNRLNPFFKLSQDSTYAKRLLSGMFETAEIPGCYIKKLSKEESTIRYSIAATKITEEAGHYFLKLPFSTLGVDGWHMSELVTARTEPFEIPFPVNESYRYSLTLPEGFELVSPETSMSLKKDFGNIQINIAQEGRTLQINRSIHIDKTILEPGAYADFRQLMNSWNNWKYREIIFRKGPK